MSYTSRLPRRRKFLSGALAILAATSMIGVYAAFTESTATETQNITTGSGNLVLTNGSLRATINSSVSDLVPGDWVTRDVTVTNEATYDMKSISMEVTDSQTGAPFTTDPEGLQLTVQREDSPGAWVNIYGSGTPTGLVLSNIAGGALSSGGSTNLRITQTFVGPNTSKSLKGAQANLTYTFQGIQRAAAGTTVSYKDTVMADSPNSFIDLSGLTLGQTTAADTLTDTANGNSLNRDGSDRVTASPSIGSKTGQSGSGNTVLSENVNAASTVESLETWVESTDTPTNYSAIYRVVDQTTTSYFQVRTIAGGGFQLIAQNGLPGGGTCYSPVVGTSNNVAYHLVAVLDGTNMTTYVNGVAVDTSPCAYVPAMTSAAFIQFMTNNQPIEISDSAYYTYSLSAAKVLAHYNAGA